MRLININSQLLKINFLFLSLCLLVNKQCFSEEVDGKMKIKLPKPRIGEGMTLSVTLNKRQSWRNFSSKALTLEEVSQILWSAGGKRIDAVSGATRTYPSAGATYPLEIYLIAGKDSIKELEEGVYLYLWREHSLEKKLSGDIREPLATACLNQNFIADAPISIAIVADYARTVGHYGQRGVRYVHMEVGNVTQNLHLVAEELGLGTVIIGAFSDAAVNKILGLPKNFEPLALMPIGYKK